ncbi:extracellular solute-binding protein [Nocardioides cheoyonin]|uniref:extracellular solute-binding protein n=1 Tax=Nocardioides cheoyonin TaxID=3156615 RepID=UPI0032B418E0
MKNPVNPMRNRSILDTAQTRRLVPAVLSIAVTAALTTACGGGSSSSASDNTLVLGCYPAASGTNWNTLFKKYVEPAFKKMTGAKISYIQGNSLDTVAKLQAERNDPQMDAACIDTGPNILAQQRGLIATNDASIVTNLTKVKSYAKDKNNLGVTISSLAAGLAYNTKEYKAHNLPAPTSWNDLTDPAVKGHVVLTDVSNTLGVTMLAMLARTNGGSESDIDPGFDAAKEVAANSFASTNNDDVSSYYQSGGAWLSLWTNSEEATFESTSKFPVKFVYPNEGAVAIGQTIAAVKNSPHPELAQKFIQLMLSPEIQKQLGELCSLTPVVSGVKLSAKAAKTVGLGKRLVSLDWATINKERDAWTQQWAQDVTSNLH